MLRTLEPNTRFVLAFAQTGPRLELRHVQAEALGGDLYRLQAVVVNSGYLPTYGSRKALEVKAVQPIEVEVSLPAGGEIVSGERRQEIGQLEGRANKRALWGGSFPTDHLRRLTWTIRAPAGSSVTVIARSQRAGTARATVNL